MQQQNTQQTAAAAPIERVFDESGQTVYEGAPLPDGQQPPAEEPEVIEDGGEPAPAAASAAPAPAARKAAGGGAKFRIGDREFATQDEAIAYAEETARSANAQQQMLQHLQQPAPMQQSGVTPAAQAPQQVPEEFFTNPSAYLQKFGQQVYERTMLQVQQMQNSSVESERIWREFTDRHPELADFRGDVESFTQGNLQSVQGIISTKGRSAGLDYIATKLKADWSRKADMLRPKRELPNGQQQRTPTQRSAGGAAGVTPEGGGKKPLTFSEQVNIFRKRGRRA